MTSVAEQATGQSEHKRRANDLIHESLHEHFGVDPLAFFCECSLARCFETVWLTTAEYETGRRRARWSARARGH